jgi:hypothetical protein
MKRESNGTSGTPPPADTDNTTLPAARAEFPQFRIWQETTNNRIRYIARSLHRGIHPHTVVTADLGELRAELSAGLDASRPATGSAQKDACS